MADSIILNWKPIFYDGEISVTSMLMTDVEVEMCRLRVVTYDYKILVTILATFVIDIHYLLTRASGINIQKMLPTSTNRHKL